MRYGRRRGGSTLDRYRYSRLLGSKIPSSMRKYFSLDYKFYRGGAIEDGEVESCGGIVEDEEPTEAVNKLTEVSEKPAEAVKKQNKGTVVTSRKLPNLFGEGYLQVKAGKVESDLVSSIKCDTEKKLLEETFSTLPRYFSIQDVILSSKFAKGLISLGTFTSEMFNTSYCYRLAYIDYCDKVGTALDAVLKKSLQYSNVIHIFDYYEGYKMYNLSDITESVRLSREKVSSVTQEEIEVQEEQGTPTKEITPEEKEVERVLSTCDEVMEWLVHSEENSTEEEKATELVTISESTEATEESEYDELETRLEKKAESKAANKKKKSKTKGTKVSQKQEKPSKKKKKVEKNNFFGNDFSVARDKNVLFYFVGKIENQINLLNAIECKAGSVYSIRDLNQRVRKNTGSHLQYTKEKVLIQDATSISPDCRYLLLNLSLTGKVSDLPLYILFFRNASNARFICQGRVESLEAYKTHILNPDKDIQIVKNTLVENILKEPEVVVVREVAVTKEGKESNGTAEVEVEDSIVPNLDTQTSVDDMISITDIDTMTEEWIQSEKSENKYSKAGSATLNYSTYIGRRPQIARCNITIGVSSNFYKTLGNRMLPCWLSDNVYKCNIYLEILLGRFESKFFLKELTHGVHYLRNSKHTYYIINSGLVDIFGNDIFFSFKCTRTENKVQFSSLDIVTSIKSAQILNFSISLLELYQLKAISLWDKGTEYFDAKMEDFDFLSMERLLHVTHERSYRYPSAVAKLSVDRLFTYIKDSIKIAVRISQVDTEYVKPIFYPCDVTRLEYFIPVHIFTSISEEPELGVIVNKDPDGMWNVMTVLPYEVLLTNHRMLTIYSSRGRC